MQFIDLGAQQKRIRAEIDRRIADVLNHGQYIMGPEVKDLEGKLGAYIGVKHAISCGSGTDALLMSLMAMNTGPGDAIFTSPFTFIATAEVIALLGATPVFVDIDPQTFNIDPEKLEKAISAVESGEESVYPFPKRAKETKLKPTGLIPVDLFGLPADYDAIEKVSRSFGLWMIEDAAQSVGAEYKGRKVCSFGNISCTSFFPAKPLGCYGDGGMCFTDDSEKAEILRSIRVHGQGLHKYDNVRIGINGRLDTIQAAILLAKLDVFEEELDLRQSVATRYATFLKDSPLISPRIPGGYKTAWAQYSVLARDEKHRETYLTRLKESAIPTAIYYPKPLHLQDAFGGMGYQHKDFPVAEDCASRVFSLPMHPYLSTDDQKKISDRLLSA